MARILLLTHEFEPFRGGIAAVADGLAAGATAAGHESVVVAPDYGSPQAKADAVRTYTVRRFAGHTCSMLSMDKLTRFTAHCAAEIRHIRPDLVHAVDPPAQMALAILARVRRSNPFVFTVHGTELLRYRDELFPRLWMGRGLGRVHSIHSVSEAVYRILHTLLEPLRTRRRAQSGWPHTFVEPPGIRRIWLDRPAANRTDVRARWNVAPDDLVLLTLSRRVPDKGHEDVIAAITLLPDALRRRIVYVIAGAGPDPYARRLEVAAMNGGIRVVLAGPIPDEDAIAACDGADLHVMLSQQNRTRLEGFGIAYIEAGARGLASLARDTGGVAEAVLDGETGRVLPAPAAATEIAAAVAALLNDAPVRTRMGVAARSRAQSFCWELRAAAVYDAFLQRTGIRR